MTPFARQLTARPLRVLIPLIILTLVASITLTRAQGGSASDPAAAAAALQASLTSAQRQAIGAELAARQAELATIAADLSAVFGGPTGSSVVYLPLGIGGGAMPRSLSLPGADLTAAVAPDSASAAAAERASQRLSAVIADVEAILARHLTPEQLELYRSAKAAPPALAAAPTEAATSAPAAATSCDTCTPRYIVCFHSAQWANYAHAYVAAAKAFAIMAAFNVDFGTRSDAAIQAYISFNEAQVYTGSGLESLSAASVLLTAADTTVQNINGGTLYGVKGRSDMTRAGGLVTLATTNALSDYRASGGEIVGNVGVGGNYFSYFAYAYGAIADTLVDGSLVYAPSCAG